MQRQKPTPAKGTVRYWFNEGGGISRGVVARVSRTNLPLIRQLQSSPLKPKFKRAPHAMLVVAGINWPVWVPVEHLYSRRGSVVHMFR